jgi:predicted ArsR family transcriptional regulator
LLSVLDEVGYQPKPIDGEVRLGNCPFEDLVSDHQEVVCPMNVALCDGLLAGLGVTSLRPTYSPERDRCCVVFVRTPGIPSPA